MRYKKHGFAVALALILAMLFDPVFGQQDCSYKLVYAGSYSERLIDQAAASANLDAYRKKTERRSLYFENGAEIQLYSVRELQIKGCAVDPKVALDDSHPVDPGRLFSIHPSGVIMEIVSKPAK